MSPQRDDQVESRLSALEESRPATALRIAAVEEGVAELEQGNGVDKAPEIYEALREVMRHTGVIAKDRTGDQGYGYRGIDELQVALQPAMIDAGVVLGVEVEQVDRYPYTTQGGKAWSHVVVRVRWTFTCTSDGSQRQDVTVGEGLDGQDKAVNKALTSAFKSLGFLRFVIPSYDGSDPEAGAQAPERDPNAGASSVGGVAPTKTESAPASGGAGNMISEKQAGRALAIARSRGELIEMHGFNVINQVLLRAGLAEAERGTEYPGMVRHVRSMVNAKSYERFCAACETFGDDVDQAPSGTDDPDQPAQPPNDDIPF